MPEPLTSFKSRKLGGRTRVPGDKSISHRALLLGALATGRTRIEGMLQADDVLATARAISELGAKVEMSDGRCIVTGRGVGGLRQPAMALDLGNSGTGARLLMGLIAGHDMTATITGDASLSSRPMGRVIEPLKQMGLLIEDDRETLPLTLSGTADLLPVVYELPVPSAQVKSAVLLAGLHAPGETSVIEHLPTRDHTERMLAHFGAELRIEDRSEQRTITVSGDAELQGLDVTVPGDPSSAAFLVSAALIAPDSDILVENVLINPTRAGFYTCLQEMGADIAFENQTESSGEPIANIRARSSRLRAIDVPPERAPSMIDEYPCLAVLAAHAEGETKMSGLAELRVKESDRLAAMDQGLRACGVVSKIDGDTLIVSGDGVKGGADVATHMDHRIAMAFLVLGLGAEQAVTIDDATIIATSFPGFAETMRGLGAAIGAGEGTDA